MRYMKAVVGGRMVKNTEYSSPLSEVNLILTGCIGVRNCSTTTVHTKGANCVE